MTDLPFENTTSKKSPTAPSWILIAMIIVGFAGFLDAAYLTAKHYQGVPPTCTLIAGCEFVTTSSYATIVGVPVALLGMLFYLSVLILSALFLETKFQPIGWMLPLITTLGFLSTLWFVYVQIFILERICIYCMVSATTSTLLFFLGLALLRRLSRRKQVSPL